MFDFLSPSRYEKIISESVSSDILASRLSGISRSIRITHEFRTEQQTAAVTVAAGLVSPLVFFYVWWLLVSARARGIRRVYFMARDGQIFMEAAHVMVECWKLDIEVRYLYCSRESLLLPSYQKSDDFELYWITWGYASSITFGEICRRLCLSQDEMIPFLLNSKLSSYAAAFDMPVACDDMLHLHALLQNGSLENMIRVKSEPFFKLTLSYLEQEGFFDDIPYAVADTGWRGTSQYALSMLLDKGRKRPSHGLTGFYIGLNCEVQLYRNDVMQAFLFDWRSSRRDYRLYCFICFEMLFSANHGRTLGYERKVEAIFPVLDNPPGEGVGSLIKIHHDATVEYVHRASSSISFESYDESLTEIARRLSRGFISSPTEMEATVYGDWPMGSEIGEGDFQSLAPPMGFWQFVNCAMGKDRIKGFWPQASLVRKSQKLLCSAYNLFLDLGVLDWYRRFFLRY